MTASRWSQVVFDRRVTAAAAAMIGLIFLGCMNLTFQGRTVSVESSSYPGVACEQGKVHVPAHCVIEVFYPRAFSSKPNLEFDELFDCCELVEQRDDGFRIRNRSAFGATVEWAARGMTCDAPPASGPPVVAPVAATAGPPAEPMPVTSPKPEPVRP